MLPPRQQSSILQGKTSLLTGQTEALPHFCRRAGKRKMFELSVPFQSISSSIQPDGSGFPVNMLGIGE